MVATGLGLVALNAGTAIWWWDRGRPGMAALFVLGLVACVVCAARWERDGR
jgi:hypothetical protein